MPSYPYISGPYPSKKQKESKKTPTGPKSTKKDQTDTKRTKENQQAGRDGFLGPFGIFLSPFAPICQMERWDPFQNTDTKEHHVIVHRVLHRFGERQLCNQYLAKAQRKLKYSSTAVSQNIFTTVPFKLVQR